MKALKGIIYRALGFSRVVADFILPILSSQANQSLARLLPKAYVIVSELAKDKNLANPKKRQIAIQKLIKEVKSEGIETTESLINMAIELAVIKTKEM